MYGSVTEETSIQRRAKGPAKFVRYTEVSLYRGFFPYILLLPGFVEVRYIEVTLYMCETQTIKAIIQTVGVVLKYCC